MVIQSKRHIDQKSEAVTTRANKILHEVRARLQEKKPENGSISTAEGVNFKGFLPSFPTAKADTEDGEGEEDHEDLDLLPERQLLAKELKAMGYEFQAAPQSQIHNLIRAFI